MTPERVLVSAVLAHPDLCDALDVQTEDLSDPTLASIWEAVLTLRGERRRVSKFSVAALLPHLHGFLTDLPEPPVHAGEDAARHVLASSVRARMLLRVAAAAKAHPRGGDPFLDAVSESLDQVSRRRRDATPTVLEVATARAAALLSGAGKTYHVKTGLTKLDEHTGGLVRGTPTILAARPKVGKSAIARSIAGYVVGRGGGVHVFSMEDSKTVYSDRILAEGMGLPLRDLWAGRVDASSVASAIPRHWLIDDTVGLTARQICRRARGAARRIGTQLVVVDYVQLVRGEGRNTSEPSIIADAMVEFTGLARDLDCAVVILSQINRGTEQREGRRPVSSDLKWSGALEEVGKAVLLAHRPRENQPGDDEIALIVDRHNSAEAGQEFLFGWDGPRTRIYNKG